MDNIQVFDAVIFDLDGTLWDPMIGLYPGVREGLKTLAQKYPLFIVSNCQEGYIENFLSRFSLESYFKDFESLGRTGATKAHNLKSIVERNQLRKAVYVGDTEGDQRAAMEAKLPFWFVSYGFGQSSGSVLTFSSFDELVQTFLACEA